MEAIQTQEQFRNGTLDEVISRYLTVLVDTSALIGFLNGNNHDRDSIESLEIAYNSAKFFMEYFWRGQIYTTERVLEEYAKAPFDETHSSVTRGYYSNVKRREIELRSENATISKSLTRMIKRGSVVLLNDKEREIYNVFGQTMRFCEGAYRLSETDLDLLTSAAALAKAREPAAVVSNDIPMRRVWRNYLGLSGTDRRDFGFFTRMHFNKTNVFQMCW